MTREIHRNVFLKTQDYLVHLSQTETNQPNRQERERNKTARRKLEKNKITEADLVDKLRDKLGAVTCHPFSFRKERFHSLPLTYCKCHQEMALGCQHSWGFISAKKTAWSKVTPPPRAAHILRQKNMEAEQPCRSSQLRVSLRAFPAPQPAVGLAYSDVKIPLLVPLPNLAPSPSDHPKNAL